MCIVALVVLWFFAYALSFAGHKFSHPSTFFEWMPGFATFGWLILPLTFLNNTVGYSDTVGPPTGEWFFLWHGILLFAGHLLFVITKRWFLFAVLSILVSISTWGACEFFTHLEMF